MARILFVSGYYPPFAPVGAVRPPKLAGHWARAGHEVRVVAIRNVDLWRVSGNAGAGAVPPPGVTRLGGAVEFAAAPGGIELAHLPWTNGDPPAAPDTPTPASAPPPGRDRLAGPRALYQQWATTPDRYARWVRAWAGPVASVARAWKPRFIYSSGPPQSSHRLAARVTRATNIPWIAESRDLWVDDPYDRRPWAFKRLSAAIADATLIDAQGFVAVTQGAAATLRRRYGRPVAVAMNGFDAADYDGLDARTPLDPARLTILHAGVIYAGRRDARPLLEALATMTPAERAQVAVHFHHDEGAYVASVVERLGLASCVHFHPLVPRREILAIERAADILLLCRWDDPRDDDVIPGKLFEYIGARRPILSVGSESGEAAAIVRAGGFGLVSNAPAAIAAWLRARLADKRATPRLPDLPAQAVEPYDRRWQFETIDRFIDELVA